MNVLDLAYVVYGAVLLVFAILMIAGVRRELNGQPNGRILMVVAGAMLALLPLFVLFLGLPAPNKLFPLR